MTNSPYDPPLYWQPGRGGNLIGGTVIAREGKHGNDVDDSGQGLIHCFLANWPRTVSQDLGVMVHMMSAAVGQGPAGKDVHAEQLDGSQLWCSVMPEGTVFGFNRPPEWGGGRLPEGGSGGAPGSQNVSYVGAPADKG